MSIGSRIKMVRKYNNMNQKNFSSILGLSQAHISNIENDNDNPSDKLLKSICDNFHVNFEWLKNGIGEMNDTSSQTDYNNIILDIKKRLAENSDSANLELHEIINLMFKIIDKIELSDNKMFYYNHYEKLLRLLIDSFELLKVDEKDSYNASIEALRKYNDKIDNIIFEINRVMKLMLK